MQRFPVKDLAGLKFNYWKKKMRAKSLPKYRVRRGGGLQFGNCCRNLKRLLCCLRTPPCNIKCATCSSSMCLLAIMITCFVLYLMAPLEEEVPSSELSLAEYSGGDAGEQGMGEQDEGEQDVGEKDTREQDASEQNAGEQVEGELDAGQQGEGEQDVGQQGEGEQHAGQQDEGEQDAGQQREGQQDAAEQGEGQQREREQDKGQQGEGEQDTGQQGKAQQDAAEQGEGQQDAREHDRGKQDTREQDITYMYGKRLEAPKPVREFCGIKFLDQMDILSMPPLPSLYNYKNPCFRSKKHGFVCFPYFFLVGMPKSGTSDIYEKLQFHPEFVPGTTKEPHFIARRRFYANETLWNYMRFIYGEAAQKIENGYGLRGRSSDIFPVITGDLSQTTMHDNDMWPILPGNDPADGEPRYTNADYIRHLFPGAKIIIQIRNPIDRLWSGYLDFSVAKKTPQEFHEHVLKSIDVYTECFKTRTVRSCVYDRMVYLKSNLEPNESFYETDGVCKWQMSSKLNLQFGLYHIYIADFLKAFPREQVFIQRLEDHQSDEVQSMIRIFDFLEMSKPYPKILNDIKEAGVFNRRYYWDRMTGDILPETRKALYEFYKPFNKKLAQLLNDEKYNYGSQ